jgi:hypothetical protein
MLFLFLGSRREPFAREKEHANAVKINAGDRSGLLDKYAILRLKRAK